MTDDNIITIEWWYHDIHGRILNTSRHGVMDIDCNFFFPNTKANVTKLLTMNGRDFDFSKPNIEKMLNCIEQRINGLNGDIEAAKASSGIRLTKEQLKDAKKRTKELKVTMNGLVRSVQDCQRKVHRCQENMKQIESWETHE